MADHQQKVGIVIHVDESIDINRQRDIERKITEKTGVSEAHFAKKRPHLIVVDYDPQQVSSLDILTQVSEQNVHAELVGPI